MYIIPMQKVKITELRASLPKYLKLVAKGEEIQITLHGKAIARIIPESNEKELAQKRLNSLKGSVIIDDIISSSSDEWTADVDNL